MNLTQFKNAMKNYYTKDKVANLAKKDFNILKILTFQDGFVGDLLPIPTGYSPANNNSPDFAAAKANRAPSKIARFVLERKRDYQSIALSDEVIRASSNDAGAFMKARIWETDNMLMNLADSLAQGICGDGSGIVGRVSAVAAGVITLTSVDDSLKLTEGQVLQTVTAVSGGTPSTDVVRVTKVDTSLGKVTYTVTGSLVVSVNDYLVPYGFYGAQITGLAAWLPLVAPTTGDNFLGVDRSVMPNRLAGVRFDGSALPLKEAIIRGHARITKIGQGKPTTCLVSHETFANLVIALDDKVRYIDKKTGDLGFQAIKLESAVGPMEIIADLYIPSDRAYVLEMDTWKLHTLGDAPMIMDLDDVTMLRESTSMDYEIRAGYYAELGCHAIGRNGVIKLS